MKFISSDTCGKPGLLSSRVLVDSALYLLFNILELSLRPLRERKIYLTNKRPEGIEPLAKWFVRSEICPRLSLQGTAALAQHQQAGHQVALVSGTPEFLIKPLAHYLDVPNVLAAQLETNADGYTCRVLSPYPYGEGKRRLLQTFADKSRGRSGAKLCVRRQPRRHSGPGSSGASPRGQSHSRDGEDCASAPVAHNSLGITTQAQS